MIMHRAIPDVTSIINDNVNAAISIKSALQQKTGKVRIGYAARNHRCLVA